MVIDVCECKQVQQREAVVRPAGGARGRMRRRNTSAASTSSAPQAVEGSLWEEVLFIRFIM